MRLRRLKREFGDRVEMDWRSFLLRPRPMRDLDLERFRAYTRSWMRPAADPDGGTFRVWEGNEGPPSHSIPPHLVAKAAATLGEAAFETIHERLMQAYFAENRDITDSRTLRTVWGEAGLPEEALARAAEPGILEATLRQHNEAIELGVNGVPAVRMEGNDVPFVGAHPIEVYRRWIQRTLGEEEKGSGTFSARPDPAKEKGKGKGA